eukprot:403376222
MNYCINIPYSYVQSCVNSILSPLDDFMIISDYQFKGKGRRQNEWLSKDSGHDDPMASLTFTYTRTIPYSQVLKFKLYPYLVGIALARSLNRLYFSQTQTKVQLKWPNDAFLNGAKFSGCLEEGEKIMFQNLQTSSAQNDQIEWGKVFIGIGININQDHGFTCISKHLNEQQKATLSKLDIMIEFQKEFLELEKLLSVDGSLNEYNNLENRQNIRKLLDMYENLWIHNGQNVSIEVPDYQIPGIRLQGQVAGITDEGFLKIKVGENVYETYPTDDYSLDIKNSRIIRKIQ